MDTSSSSSQDDFEIGPSLENTDVDQKIAVAQLTRYKEIQKVLNILIKKLDIVCKAVDEHNANMTRLNYKVRNNKKKLRRLYAIEEKILALENTNVKSKTVVATMSFIIGILASAGILTSSSFYF